MAIETSSVEQRIATRVDPETARQLPVSYSAGGFQFSRFSEVVELAKYMAVSREAVPAYLRNNPGACLAVAMQAIQWSMDPWAVARQSYNVNDTIAYMSALVHSLVVRRAPIKGRIKVEYAGENSTRSCRVWADLADGTGIVEYQSPPIAKVSRERGSPLWKTDPDQQLFYYSVRSLARRHFPDVLMGVYTREEMEDAPRREPVDITPPQSLKDRLTALAGPREPPKEEPEDDDKDKDIAPEPTPIDPPAEEGIDESEPEPELGPLPDDPAHVEVRAFNRGKRDAMAKVTKAPASVLGNAVLLTRWRQGYDTIEQPEEVQE